MPTLDETADADADELPPDSQFESFYDKDSGAWTLRRIPSSPPAGVPEEPARALGGPVAPSPGGAGAS
jgi:hypothetical protein